MPIYEYRCERGHAFECLQRMGADPIAACTVCEAPAARVFSAPAVHFKGSGFYTPDYGKKGRGAASSNGSDGGKSETASESKTESKSAASSNSNSGSGSGSGSGSAEGSSSSSSSH